jgi:hypothetical protein
MVRWLSLCLQQHCCCCCIALLWCIVWVHSCSITNATQSILRADLVASTEATAPLPN